MKIIQLLVTLAYGDGVGNDVLALDKIFKELGYTAKIYAENIDPRIDGSIAERVADMPCLEKDDIILYHLSTGTDLNYQLRSYSCRKLLIYHNVTPPEYFRNYSLQSLKLCTEGRRAITELRDVPDFCWADSEFNKRELLEAGYQCKVDVIPILIPFEDYKAVPQKSIIDRYQDDYINIVFMGRIAPNKKQEDIIKTFYYYKKNINYRSRLFLVGSYEGMEQYFNKLKRYVECLELEDVVITGHIRFKDILAYYSLADVFLCMSEHEGFCIPLLEAMYFKVPIIAYADTGVKETLGDAGLKFYEKDHKVAAEMIYLATQNEVLRDKIIAQQNKRLEDFSYEKTCNKIVASLKGFIR